MEGLTNFGITGVLFSAAGVIANVITYAGFG